MVKDWWSVFSVQLPAGTFDEVKEVWVTSDAEEFNNGWLQCGFDQFGDDWLAIWWPGYDPLREPWGGTRQINITISISGKKSGSEVPDVLIEDQPFVLAKYGRVGASTDKGARKLKPVGKAAEKKGGKPQQGGK
jgi:hypothetical protein